MLAVVPEDYDRNYLTMSRRGARVLALGWRDLGSLSNQQLKVINNNISILCDKAIRTGRGYRERKKTMR